MSSHVWREGRFRGSWMRTAARTGWPASAGFAAFFLGLAMLGGVAYFDRTAMGQQALLNQPDSWRESASTSPLRQLSADGPILQAPTYDLHLWDMRRIFELAKEQGVTIGAVDYRTEPNPPSPFLVRSVDLRINEEYPKFKAFVAEMLKTMPHLYLQEIRIEKASANSPKMQVTLKLSLVYQGAGGR